jgi:hypothetical protein
MTEHPTTPEPPVTPMPRLGRGVTWSAHPGIDGIVPPTEPYQPKPRTRPVGWPKTGDVGATTQLRADELPVTAPARPYGEPRHGPVVTGRFAEALNDAVERANRATDAGNFDRQLQGLPPLPLLPVPPRSPGYPCGLPPRPAAELLAMANDLNAHGGLDETFVAELLRQAADPLADAKRGLGIVDPPPAPVKTTEPISYETIIAALEKVAPLGPTPLDTVKLTQGQIDAFPHTRHTAPSDQPWHYFGTPVELVETVEESTPYQLANAQPGGIVEFRGDLTEAEFKTLRADWLRAIDAKPRLYRWIVEPRARVVPFGEPFRPLAGVLDEQPAPPRPWWRRALDRVRRWTR